MAHRGMMFDKWWRACLLCLTLAVFASTWSTAAANEERTLELHESAARHPYTTVMINGESATALLDTGATIALIDRRLVDIEFDAAAPLDEARILGIGGKRKYPVTQLDNLSAGSERWTDIRVAVNTESQFPVHRTIMPVSIFDTRVVDFDFANHQVHLYDGRPKRVRRAHKSWLNYQNVNDLIFVTVRINGVYGKALVDTGADVSFVNERFAHDTRAVLDEVRTQLIRGSDLSNNRASVYTFRHMRFADNEINRITLPVLDTELFEELGFADQPMMVMGMDLLRQFRLQIDRERERVYFVLPMDRRPIGEAARIMRSSRRGNS